MEYQEANRAQRVYELFSDVNCKTPWVSPRTINVQAVVNAIINAITQPPYQRLFDPSGFDLETFLFRLSDASLEQQLLVYLEYISKDDDRYEVDRPSTEIIKIDKDNHILTIQIGFRLLPPDGQVYTFIGRIRV